MTVYEQLRNKYNNSVPALGSDIEERSSLMENLTLDEMFRLSLESYEVFNRFSKIESYIKSNNICYESKTKYPSFWFDSDRVHGSNVSKVWGKLDDAIPKACGIEEKIFLVTHGKQAETKMSANYYDMIKLPSPYPDDCFDYTSIGYVDQHNAIAMCKLDYAMTKKLIPYYGFCYKKSEAEYLPYRMEILDGDNCDVLHHRVDCRKKYFSMVSSTDVTDPDFNRTSVVFWAISGSDPSFRIESKPRIDNIDYITYVCGALGTWFGICALNFNPFPIFFQPNEPIGDNTNAADHFVVTPSRVKKLEERLAILSASFHLQLAAMSGQVKELSQDVKRLNTKDELVMSEIR